MPCKGPCGRPELKSMAPSVIALEHPSLTSGIGYGWGTLTGERPLNSHRQHLDPLSWGDRQSRRSHVFSLVINSSGQGEERTAEAKGLGLPLELGP